jgi:hypothetical protein
MGHLAYLLSFLLSSMGLTILVVWPQDGPGAWVRERLLRKGLPGKAEEVLDCYVCTGFWAGLILSPPWWLMGAENWAWAGCLMTPALFWLVLRNPGNDGTPMNLRDSGREDGTRDEPSSRFPGGSGWG